MLCLSSGLGSEESQSLTHLPSRPAPPTSQLLYGPPASSHTAVSGDAPGLLGLPEPKVRQSLEMGFDFFFLFFPPSPNQAQAKDLLKQKAGGFGSCTKITLSSALARLWEVSEPPLKAATP